jgi:hypothetical protein
MRGLSEKTLELIRYAHGLLKADHPQTLRQLHYAIFSRGEIGYENDQADYKRLSRATTVARRTYRWWELWQLKNSKVVGASVADLARDAIPPDWMVDETRQPETVNVWENAAAYIETVKRCYRRDNWQDQHHYCEVWSEKGTILGAIRPVAEEWGITLRVCHGFASAGMEQQIAGFFEGIGKPISVFYLGDHDPSGHAIEEDIHRRVEVASGLSFGMERLAIHGADIVKFNLPPQRIKASDSRAAGFRQRYGSNAATVELDALPAAELRRRVKKAVTRLIDFETWNQQVMVQQVEFDSIAHFAECLKALPQVQVNT